AFYQKYFASSPDRLLSRRAKLRKELEHSPIRKSSRRCLRCGQTNVSRFVYGKWAPHPKSQEEVFFIAVGIGSTSVNWRFFNPEGKEFIPTDAERQHFISIICKRNVSKTVDTE